MSHRRLRVFTISKHELPWISLRQLRAAWDAPQIAPQGLKVAQTLPVGNPSSMPSRANG